MRPMSLQWPNNLWRPYDPETLGVKGADLLVGRTGLPGSYTPLMTVSERVLEAEVSLEEFADQLAKQFASQTGSAVRTHRALSEEDAPSPGVSQTLTATLEVDGQTYDLRHVDLTVGTRDPDGQVTMVCFGLTCTAEQLSVVLPEFTYVVKSMSGEEETDQPAGEN